MINPHCFTFELKDMEAGTWQVIDFWLFLVILCFENFLPPWSAILLDLCGEDGIVDDEALVLHVFINPFESIIIALDLNRAVQFLPYLLHYIIEDKVKSSDGTTTHTE
jgi:hypothetical protein